LRMVTSFFSIFLVPLIYEIVLELSSSYWFAVVGALLVCFENSLVVHGRFVLLDVILVFFICALLCSYVKFLKEHSRPFGWNWWKYLFLLGFSITGAVSVKYAGMLSIIVIGALIGYELWLLVGDITVPVKSVYKHITARFIFLIVMPIVLYIGQFYIMLSVLQKTGLHDGLMSSSFQKTLEGGLESITKNQAQIISYGSHITLRNTHSKQCWLHSHKHLYPVKYEDGRGSSAQQQVTCYAFKDINNWFIVKHPDSDSLKVDFPPRPVKNGDVIHLVHGLTGRGISSHDVGAPVNPTLMEVSGYVDHNVSMDAQYGWKLQIVNPDESELWRAIGSQVRFVHVNTSAAIKVSGSTLPEWGFRQYEVGTDRRINTQESIWNVEEHNQNVTKPEDMSDEEAKRVLSEHAERYQVFGKTHAMSFFQKFFEYQIKMFKVNNDLTNGHAFASKPLHWPLMLKGVAYWLDTDTNKQIFIIGNPIVYWLGAISLLIYMALLALYLLRRKRQCYDLDNAEWNNFSIGCYLLIGGFLLNWLPYFPVERTLFLHNYLPALIFKIILIPMLMDHVHSVWFKNFPILQYGVKAASVLIVGLVVFVFQYFSAFTYGVTALSQRDIEQKRWLSSWRFMIHR